MTASQDSSPTVPGPAGPASPLADCTVVVPVYNGRAFLEETVQAVGRAGLRDRQLVFVDDCSDDGSADCIAASFPEARLIRNARNLRGVTRHVGLAAVATPFVLFLDQDDLLCRGGPEALVRALRSRPEAVAAVGRTLCFSGPPSGRRVWSDRTRPWPRRLGVWKAAAFDVHLSLPPLGGWLVRTRAAASILLDDRKGRLIGAAWNHDWAFLTHLAASGPVLRVPDVTLLYRVRDGAPRSVGSRAVGPVAELYEQIRSVHRARFGIGTTARFHRFLEARVVAERAFSEGRFGASAGLYLKAAVLGLAAVRSRQMVHSPLLGVLSSVAGLVRRRR